MGDPLDDLIDSALSGGGKTPSTSYDTFTDANGDTWSVVNGVKGAYLGRTRAPGTSSSTSSNSSTSSSTSQSFQDPVYLEILRQQGRDAADQFWAKMQAEAQQGALDRTWRTNERLGGQTFATGERLGGQQFTAGENQLGRDFTAEENALGRQFSAEESALDRALNAGQFAATLAIQQKRDKFSAEQDYQNRIRQYAMDKLTAAQAFATQVGAVDPAALEAFYAAGGGNIANALAGGASAVSDNAVLPAARSLRATREMLAPTRYSGFDDPYQPPPVPTSAAGGFTRTPVRPPVKPPTAGYNPDGSYSYKNPDGTPAIIGSPVGGYSPAPTSATQPVFADVGGGSVGMGTGGESPLDRPGTPDFVRNAPRYAFGTMGEPAKGTFITGDSTHPTDPFAGGAKPEKVTVKDPPGPNNAEAEVEPMAPPMEMGVKPKLAELFHVIGSLLDGEGMEMMGEGMGEEEPRYAFGTGGYETITPTPEDQPYMDEVRGIRSRVQFPMLNPYDTKFRLNPYSQQSRYFAGMQTKFGVPVEDQMQEQRRYQLQGVNRGAYSLGT